MQLQERNSSAGFRHLWRSLESGETLPRIPSLLEQLTACARAAAEPAPTAEVGSDAEAEAEAIADLDDLDTD